MLDVHVLTLHDTPREWVQQRRESIAEAVAAAGYPVHVHEIDGELGHIGRGRARGYALGTQPYVTYIDCDDYVQSGAFAALADALVAGHDAVGPGETLEREGVRWQCPDPHHLICYRRDVANRFDNRQWRVCGDLALAHRTAIHRVADYSYVHRQYESPGRLLRRKHQDELMRVMYD
ncbi:hypothetical protein [Xanthomonas albilineans]|uniref:hypothetical protein n=1 Tax=Xanthomonas albilineans TaxID=29447 RepID=UPI0006967B86|nr:hypothetical protein [Xanthomonas albilineans]